jgi:hypothetical protein
MKFKIKDEIAEDVLEAFLHVEKDGCSLVLTVSGIRILRLDSLGVHRFSPDGFTGIQKDNCGRVLDY